MKVLKKAIVASLFAACMLQAADVLASVNGVAIKKSDIQSVLKARGIDFDKLPKEQQEKIVNKLIERELLASVAKKAGIDKSDEYKKALENYKKDLLIKVWMDDLYKKTLVSESEAKKYYEDHKNQFKIPASVHARHILVKSEDEAKKIINELKNLKGDALKKKFIELAKEKSIGPSGKNGGDLGYFTKGQMVKPFEEAAFKLKPGQITLKPVKTQFGYHIILVEDKKDESVRKFEDVKNLILMQLRQKEFSKKINDILKNQKKMAKIINNFAKSKDKNSSK